jgi:ribonuclease T2
MKQKWIKAIFLGVFGLIAMTFAQNNSRIQSYILSMSWSPAFCQTNSHEMQCDPQADYGLILHGLWPEYTDNSTYCETDHRPPTHFEVNQMLDITPAPELIRHEWRKHGSCTGQSAQAYFDMARDAFELVCNRNTLREIRLCLDAELNPQACNPSPNTCSSSVITIPKAP